METLQRLYLKEYQNYWTNTNTSTVDSHQTDC